MNINAIPSAIEQAEKAAVDRINAISDHIAGIGTNHLPAALTRLEEEVKGAKDRLQEGHDRVKMTLLSLLTDANVFVSSLDIPEKECLPEPKKKLVKKA